MFDLPFYYTCQHLYKPFQSYYLQIYIFIISNPIILTPFYHNFSLNKVAGHRGCIFPTKDVLYLYEFSKIISINYFFICMISFHKGLW